MHAGQRYSLKEFLLWTRRDTYGFVIASAIPTVLYKVLNLHWLALPWVPIALVGTAAAFIVGFRNNATYARLWEARQIYGAIVNASRTFGVMARDLVQPNDTLTADDAQQARTRLIHRHIAWLTALRFQLRQPRPWESMSQPHNVEYRKGLFTVDELSSDLGTELAKLLSVDEQTRVMSLSNRATQVLALQSEHIAQLFALRAFEPNANVALVQALSTLYEQQGKCERIKNFPYPRQFATINQIFVRVFVWLVPFGMLGELQKLGDDMVWLTVPLSVLVAWVFNGMERVGEVTENPFEGGPNDVPITSMSRSIEIDLREMLGEANIPATIGATNNILM